MSDTVCSKFLETALRHPDRVAVEFSRRGTWLELVWADYVSLVQEASAGMLALGVKSGDRVGIWSNTRLEWAICDLAALSIGAIVVPIYQNSSKDDIACMLEDSAPKIVFCESPDLAARGGVTDEGRFVSGGASSASRIWRMIWFDSKDATKATAAQTRRGASADADGSPIAPTPDSVRSLDDLQALGAKALRDDPKQLEEPLRKLTLATPATIVYTSGTTGRPKGAVITHAQIMSQISEAFPLLGVTAKDKSLTFLPYAHVLGRIEIWGHALIGYVMAYAESIERMKDDLQRAKPTIMMAVPRIFEKIYGGILAQAEISPWRKKLFEWALDVGRDISRRKEDKLPAPLDLAIKYRLAQKLVFDQVQDRLGGRLRFCVSGGAPLARPVAEFFHACGILILEGYGLTETTAAICVNTPFDYRFGTVGKPIGDVRIKLAADGEILIKSKKVMTEYWNDPASTAAAFEDGWYRSGDIGEISSDGSLRIVDRKKELIKTSGGKYVAPQKLEGLLMASPLFSHVHIVGDQRKYVVALVTLNSAAVAGAVSGGSSTRASREEIADSPIAKEMVRKAIASANANLASYESIKNFAILPRDFTVEGGELTPSLKIKRKFVNERYRETIDKLYGP